MVGDLMFWLAAAALMFAIGVLMTTWAAARPRVEVEDAAVVIHRRQLEEVDALMARGLLTGDAVERARTEAGRRLLIASGGNARRIVPETKFTRLATLAAVAAPALAALGLYAWVGSPGVRDNPHAARVASWRRADPATLNSPQVAAVIEQIVSERPDDAAAWRYLGRARLESGDAFGALSAFRRGVTLAPRDASMWEGLGEAFVATDQGRISGDARRAFAEALRRNPDAVVARVALGRAQAEAGDRTGAVVLWREAAARMAANDPRRLAIDADIARLEGRSVPTGTVDDAILGMVGRLQARLDTQPEDPAGWVRLVRAYRVLGDTVALQAALTRARTVFHDRPDALNPIEQAARTEPTTRTPTTG